MKKFLLSLMILVVCALSAHAASGNWYRYWAEVDTYPTGAGKVYVNDAPDYDNFLLPDNPAWVEKATVNITSDRGGFFLYAEPAEGWNFVGVVMNKFEGDDPENFIEGTVVVLDNGGNPVWDYENLTTANALADYPLVSLRSDVTKTIQDGDQEVSADSTTVAALPILEPNNYVRALFARVTATVDPVYGNVAEVSISNLANKDGDEITLKATASEGTRFLNWTKDGEIVSTEAEYKLTVNGQANYVAHFKNDHEVVLNFPEEGGYLPWYAKMDYNLLGTGVMAYSPAFYEDIENDCLVDSLDDNGQRFSFLNMEGGNFQAGGKLALLLYGFGAVTLVPNDTIEASDPWGTQLFQWTDESGLAVGGLNQSEVKYYTFNQNGKQFDLITEGSIAPNSLYMIMPDSLMLAGQPAPAVIYLTKELDPAGISSPSLKNITLKKTVYDLTGRRVDAINREGIYVFDGKKVIYRKK